MEVIYFYEQPKLNGYHFSQTTDFKYGVEFTFWTDESFYRDYQELLIPLMGTLVETYGADPKRYEFLPNEEDGMYRVYFKDEEDQAAFKLIYPGEWDPDPVWDDDEE